MALELRGNCERCGAEPRPRCSGDDLLLRVHVLPVVRDRARARLPELRRRARRPAAPHVVTGATAPLRPPAVLRLALRLLRLRHRRRARTTSTAATSTRSLRELELERDLLADPLETVYLGGGTPTLTQPAALERLLAALPACDELTVEANPETVTPELADAASALRRRPGLARRADLRAASARDTRARSLTGRRPACVRRSARCRLRQHLARSDLRHPGPEPADLARDLAEALALAPEHISAYELEAKPGTRFTHAHGAELERQAESMESYFELVVETLTARRLPLVRDRELLPRPTGGRSRPARAAQPRLLARARLSRARRGSRQHDRPVAPAQRAVARRATSPRSSGASGRRARSRSCRRRSAQTERLMLGLRLDRPLPLDGLEGLVDDGRGRAPRASSGSSSARQGRSRSRDRGRFLGGGVTARLLA